MKKLLRLVIVLLFSLSIYTNLYLYIQKYVEPSTRVKDYLMGYLDGVKDTNYYKTLVFSTTEEAVGMTFKILRQSLNRFIKEEGIKYEEE